MSHKIRRNRYADYIIRAVREDSPWIIDMRGGLSLLLLRDLTVDNNQVKSGLLIDFRPIPDVVRSGRLSPMILVREGDGWRILDSMWALGRIAGGTVASAFSQNPSLLLDPLSSAAVVRKVLARIKEIGIWQGDDFAEIMRSQSEPSVIGERSGEEIQLVLESILGYLRDEGVSVAGRISVLLGSWSVEDFRKQFSLGLEAIRIIEDEAQVIYDKIHQLVRVDEFVSFRQDEFNLSGRTAEVSHFVSLGWIFYSFERNPSGEGLSKEYYNELGRVPVEIELDLDDITGWKEVMVRCSRRILDDWLSKKGDILSEEPEVNLKSETLSRMLRNVLGEEYSLSGSLEGFF
ncbi:MAG: hypothetical protein BA066_02165 [Candidatus Korarchaeota archaeon NZ13-K]|nr:MAG: hypothetical protein BA066_02165 [Candidatus Korarchaeota archaeon NZ13-K]